MVTFTEKERKWILSDAGEISFGGDGRLQPLITPSMFIESPSSLDLMLGMQKKPSWECGFVANKSKALETDCSQHVSNSKASPPPPKRKRKASWGGGFEDKERLSKPDSAEKNGLLNGERIGHSQISEEVCNLQIQYVAKSSRIKSSVRTEFVVETKEFLPPKKPNNLGTNIVENRAQQCGQDTRHKAKVSSTYVTSLVNPRIKKRLKKLQASESAGNSHCRELPQSLQQVKVVQSVQNGPNLLMPYDGRVEEGSFTRKRCKKLPPSATPTFANGASSGEILSAPSSKKNSRCKKDVSTNHVKKNHQGRALNVKWKEADNSSLGGSLEKHDRRVETVKLQHGREDRCSFSIFEHRKSETKSAKVELVSERAPAHVENPPVKNCCGNASSNGKGSTSSTWENSARAYPKSTKSEKVRLPSISSALKHEAENALASSTLENLATKYPKSAKSENGEIPLIQNTSREQAGNGSASSTREKASGYQKSNKSEKVKIPLTSSTDETGHHSNKKDSKDDQTGCQKGSQAPQLKRGGNATSDADSKQSHKNVDDAPVNEDCDLGQEGNARARTKKLLQLFHKIHKQFKGGHKEVDVRNIIVECYPEYLVNGSDSIYGDVPGVEAGDRFNYRVEMDLVGLHHQFRRGIDVIPASKSTWCIPGNPKPVSVAACIVVAGGYVDNRDEGDIIIYTGEGGNNHFHDKGPSKDQMLTFGNKALRHSRMLNLSVRVIRKFDIKPPTKPYYRYDGLYEVVDMKKARSGGHRRKAVCHGENGTKLKISKFKTVSFKPLVYKFLLVRKSAKEKYKNVNLWAYKPPSSARVLNSD
ncbi:unnamed protein product [Calypogeia fissa]